MESRIARAILIATITFVLVACGDDSEEEEAGAAAVDDSGDGPAVSAAADNHPPVILSSPRKVVTAGQFYDFVPQAFDPDGDPLSFEIENMPVWADFEPATGRMSGTPASVDIGIHAGIIILISDGADTVEFGPFVVSVNTPAAQNAPPIITGVPATTVVEGVSYSFQPQATDSDNDPLSFLVFNAPSWLNFDTSTGLLSGTPESGDVGSYASITIAVSDGRSSDSLPAFSIDVISNNRVPAISGSPAASVLVNTAYSFSPTASDPDGDDLNFSIENLPVWASFDSADGSLSGTPAPGDVGIYSNILITVSDGRATDSLGPFTVHVQASANGSASLTWIPPTEYTDGAPLIVDQYQIYWGTASGNYTNSASVGGGLTSFVVDQLLSGTTYYFSITALDAQNTESVFSNEASRAIP